MVPVWSPAFRRPSMRLAMGWSFGSLAPKAFGGLQTQTRARCFSTLTRLLRSGLGSGQNWRHDFPCHVGEPIISPLKTLGKFGLINANWLQDRCLHAMAVHWVF